MTEREQQHLEAAIATLRERYETQLQAAHRRDRGTQDPRWSSDQQKAIKALQELDALERATRDLGEHVQSKLRVQLAAARTSSGIPLAAIATMLGRSRALLSGWLSRPNS